MTTTSDPRTIPAPHADERAMLESWLDFHRETLALKTAGITDEQARTVSAEPSAMTLLGLVQHLAEVERNWFRKIFAGDRDAPPVFADGGADGFGLDHDRGLAETLAIWRAEIDRARELTARASLDDSGPLSGREAAFLGDPEVSLRWILVHMIEEYARHNGHADLLRERLDGATGA
ncbi:DinB family protein [Streptomyces sp. NPDC020875]|uniref:DinB family protein n=1 Tax=Streptomyces sp. NPDC020875 TaxID=3154898 RepID=UPI00340D526A